MSDMPTSQQYKLGVEIGRAIVEAMENGATYEEVFATLEHSRQMMERNQEWGVSFAAKQGSQR